RRWRWLRVNFLYLFGLLFLRGLGRLSRRDFFGAGLVALLFFFFFGHDFFICDFRFAICDSNLKSQISNFRSQISNFKSQISYFAAFFPVRPSSAPLPTALRCLLPTFSPNFTHV